MSEPTNPLMNPERAAHELVLELTKAGKVANARIAAEMFSFILEHYRYELGRVQ
ncbi:hypothetical protein ACOA8Y_003751 [Serratia marcescens]|uniref:Uncharacterized protein n=1 Tax=Serratia marcescens TaxID=615 RepID=A0AB35YXK1_SERMA|nr:hypothetical protein [Serratia marcescens]MBH3235729.1 hypothetical protein [Serratia marcescens]